MNQKIKLYIATSLPNIERNNLFSFLDDEYERVDRKEDADLIVYDVCNKPKKWPLFLSLPSSAPPVFAALGKRDDDNFSLIQECWSAPPPVGNSQDALRGQINLAWYYVNRKREVNEEIGRSVAGNLMSRHA